MTAINLRFQALKMSTTGEDNPGFGYEKLENPESAYPLQLGGGYAPPQGQYAQVGDGEGRSGKGGGG
jgi:hypothetical protein